MVQPGCHGCYHRLFLLEPLADQSAESVSRGFIVCFISKQERGLELYPFMGIISFFGQKLAHDKIPSKIEPSSHDSNRA